MSSFDEKYQVALGRILKEGQWVNNARTGQKTISLPGLNFRIEPEDGFPLLQLRKIPIKLFVAEQVWFLSGEKKLDFFQEYSHAWDSWAEVDNTIQNAYGHRFKRHFGRDQVGLLVQTLKKDSSSRQCFVSCWDPKIDGLGEIAKNMPCLIGFTMFVLPSGLEMHVLFRSNDMVLGFPHDIAGFALLHAMIAQELGLPVSGLSWSIANAHIYETHLKAVNELLERLCPQNTITLALPQKTLKKAISDPHDTVLELITKLQTKYSPLESIKGLKPTV